MDVPSVRPFFVFYVAFSETFVPSGLGQVDTERADDGHVMSYGFQYVSTKPWPSDKGISIPTPPQSIQTFLGFPLFRPPTRSACCAADPSGAFDPPTLRGLRRAPASSASCVDSSAMKRRRPGGWESAYKRGTQIQNLRSSCSPTRERTEKYHNHIQYPRHPGSSHDVARWESQWFQATTTKPVRSVPRAPGSLLLVVTAWDPLGMAPLAQVTAIGGSRTEAEKVCGSIGEIESHRLQWIQYDPMVLYWIFCGVFSDCMECS